MTPAGTSTPCRVCRSTDVGTEELGGVLHRCARCGFRSTARPSPAPVPELEDTGYFDGGGYEQYLVPAARRFEAKRRLRWLLGFDRPATVLEAGCAAGFFLEATAAEGIRATGVEVSEAMAAHARHSLGVDARHGRLEDLTVDQPFDAVCAFHVLEHVDDPATFLAAARSALRPGGLLALEVPNIDSPAAQREGTAWAGLQPAHHRWHFGPDTLARALDVAGFTVVHCDTVVFRYYQPARYRRRAGRGQLAVDVRNLRSLRLEHRRRGDLLRMIAR